MRFYLIEKSVKPGWEEHFIGYDETGLQVGEQSMNYSVFGDCERWSGELPACFSYMLHPRLGTTLVPRQWRPLRPAELPEFLRALLPKPEQNLTVNLAMFEVTEEEVEKVTRLRDRANKAWEEHWASRAGRNRKPRARDAMQA